MPHYLCYDIKGIQHYIFQVPKLKCCIGGSRQIDEFDKKDVGKILQEIDGSASCRFKKIYSGGGKGAFSCSGEDAEDMLNLLKKSLVKKAMGKGLTIRFGLSQDYLQASREIVETYCYQPENMEGQPCSFSGMYPAGSSGKICSVMQERLHKGQREQTRSPGEETFLDAIRNEFPERDCDFFYDVDPESEEGRLGAEALGNRNRWAVICMDGNDIGSQFLVYQEKYPWKTNAEKWEEWLPRMSQKLDECTTKAAKEGMCAVARQYFRDYENDSSRWILPLRPIIVGGDDVTILVGCEYAMLFVKTVIQAFHRLSEENKDLWLGTGGSLSISAGILYAPVSLPICRGMEFAEELLASAKTKGRSQKKAGARCPSPPCIDWESVTEGLLGELSWRRRHDFLFRDESSHARFELTCRPYLLKDFEEMEELGEELANLPETLKHKLTIALRAPKFERLRFYAKIAKNYPELFLALSEPRNSHSEYGSYWKVDHQPQEWVVRTRILDILLLLQEEKRLKSETVK